MTDGPTGAETPEELYREYAGVLHDTVKNYSDESTIAMLQYGMSNWSSNDEQNMLIGDIDRHHVARVMMLASLLAAMAERDYLDTCTIQAEAAIAIIENDGDIDDDEKSIAVAEIAELTNAQTDGFMHGVALVFGFANAAVLADESDSVDWDSLLEERNE